MTGTAEQRKAENVTFHHPARLGEAEHGILCKGFSSRDFVGAQSTRHGTRPEPNRAPADLLRSVCPFCCTGRRWSRFVPDF